MCRKSTSSKAQHSFRFLRRITPVATLLIWMICLGLEAAPAGSRPHRPTVGDVAQEEAYSVRLASARQIPRQGRGPVWQYNFEVENRKTHAVKTLQFGGADQAVEDELEWFGVVGDLS